MTKKTTWTILLLIEIVLFTLFYKLIACLIIGSLVVTLLGSSIIFIKTTLNGKE